jgi:hypothetical protein
MGDQRHRDDLKPEDLRGTVYSRSVLREAVIKSTSPICPDKDRMTPEQILFILEDRLKTAEITAWVDEYGATHFQTAGCKGFKWPKEVTA